MKLGRCIFHDCSMQADADRISQLLLDSVRQVNIIYKDRLGCMALIGCMALVLWLLVKHLKFGKSSTGRTKPHQCAFSSNWLLVLLRMIRHATIMTLLRYAK